MFENGIKVRLIIMVAVAGFSYVSYLSKTSVNPVTGQKQHIGMNVDQEIAMGLQSAPEMASQMGGEVPTSAPIAQLVSKVGMTLVNSTEAASSPYAGHFQFHTLADQETVNAFALPGGQIFITQGLIKRMDPDRIEDEMSGVLGHEIGHVIARHSAQQMAKQDLEKGLVNAAVMGSGSYSGAQIASYVGNMISLKYGRNDELEADHFGVRYSSQSGHDPNAMIRVMEILEQVMAGHRQSEFMSTHPSPENRIVKLKEEIAQLQNGK